jgi:hypothetical protein
VKPWHEKPRAEWTVHDWLYAAAAELLKDGIAHIDETSASRAATVVMDFADENCGAMMMREDIRSITKEDMDDGLAIARAVRKKLRGVDE